MQIPGRTALRSGQSLHLHIAVGASIVAVRGRLKLSAAPVWLDGQMLDAQHVLEEGSSHAMQHGGWIVLEAQSAAEVLIQTAPSLLAQGCALLMRWLPASRRTLRKKAL